MRDAANGTAIAAAAALGIESHLTHFSKHGVLSTALSLHLHTKRMFCKYGVRVK
jgi:hypothetical protein